MKDYIIPIINRRDLDDVFRSIGFEIDRNNKPESYRELLNDVDIDYLLELLRGCEATNLDVMIEEVLKHDPGHQSK